MRDTRTPAALKDCIQWHSTQWVGASRVWAVWTTWDPRKCPAPATADSSSAQITLWAVADKVPRAANDQRMSEAAHTLAEPRNHFSIPFRVRESSLLRNEASFSPERLIEVARLLLSCSSRRRAELHGGRRDHLLFLWPFGDDALPDLQC